VQVLPVLSFADLGAPHVECVVSADRWDLPNHGDCQHGRHVRSDRVCVAGRVHHPQSQNQALVDLGLLVVAYHVCRDGHHCERVSGTSMGDSELRASFFLFSFLANGMHLKNN